MNAAFDRRLFFVLLALSTITLAQLSVGSLDAPGSLRSNAMVTCGAILVALIKVRIIIREFMEVRHAPRLLCRLTDLWVVLTAVSLLGGYFAGTALSRG